MGLCSSETKPSEDAPPEKKTSDMLSLPLDKAKTENGDGSDKLQRPASSTVRKNSQGSVDAAGNSPINTQRQSSGAKPPPMSLDNGTNQRQWDPNAANTTPTADNSMPAQGFAQPPPLTANDNLILPVRNNEDDQNGKAGMRMFIPWEQPVLGSNKKSKGPPFGNRDKKKSKKKGQQTELHKRSKGTKEQVFIPGSGNEKILLAGQNRDKAGKITLKPLKVDKIGADAETKKMIQKARQKRKQSKIETKTINKLLAEIGFDKDICKLVRQYAEIKVEQEDALFVMAPKSSKRNSREKERNVKKVERTVIKCPTKQSL